METIISKESSKFKTVFQLCSCNGLQRAAPAEEQFYRHFLQNYPSNVLDFILLSCNCHPYVTVMSWSYHHFIGMFKLSIKYQL